MTTAPTVKIRALVGVGIDGKWSVLGWSNADTSPADDRDVMREIDLSDSDIPEPYRFTWITATVPVPVLPPEDEVAAEVAHG